MLAANFGRRLSYYVPFDRIRIEVEELNAALFSDTAELFRNILYDNADIIAAVDDYIARTNSRHGWIDKLALINGN